MCAAWNGSRARRARSPSACARRVRSDVGLTVTVGVARTKHLAKVASRAAKPDGLLVVPAEGETAFLHPLPVEALWGVGPSTAAKLHERGIHRVEHLAAVPGPALAAMLGRAVGWHLNAIANNRDPRPVRARRRRRSLGSQSALGRPRSVAGRAGCGAGRARGPRNAPYALVRARRAHDHAATALRRLLARVALPEPGPGHRGHRDHVAHGPGLYGDARPLIADRGLTLLGLTFTNLGHVRDGVQLALPLERGSPQALDDVVDRVRERYGPQAVTRATLLRAGRELAPALSPDELEDE